MVAVSVFVEEVPCQAHPPQMERLPSLDHDHGHYSSQLRWPIARRYYVACPATSYLPSACPRRLRTVSGWDDHSRRRESRAPRPVKDSCGSDLQEDLVDGSRPSPSFVWMDLMTAVVGPTRREGG